MVREPPPNATERRVVAAIRAIPEGFVRTYGDVSPGAPRFAGHVLKTVHEPDIPWWRVVRADGSLAAGDEQRTRLEAEGVPFRPGSVARVNLRIARMTGTSSEVSA
jgi:methylated-DNA-protein-cysteine methyltransferase-like protein